MERARGFAKRMNIPLAIIDKRREDAHTVDVFNVIGEVEGKTCLLVDDMIDSGWTFTVAAALLRNEGCATVFPLALALNSPRMD